MTPRILTARTFGAESGVCNQPLVGRRKRKSKTGPTARQWRTRPSGRLSTTPEEKGIAPIRSMKIQPGKLGLSFLLSLLSKPPPADCLIPQPVTIQIRECDLSQPLALSRVNVAVICRSHDSLPVGTLPAQANDRSSLGPAPEPSRPNKDRYIDANARASPRESPFGL
jgi:hypothetical protein